MYLLLEKGDILVSTPPVLREVTVPKKVRDMYAMAKEERQTIVNYQGLDMLTQSIRVISIA